MDEYEKEKERMQTILQESDVPSKPEDDSESESDLVKENKVVPDSDDLQGEPPEKVPRCGEWLDKDKNTRWQEKVLKQQFALSRIIFSERDQDQKD